MKGSWISRIGRTLALVTLVAVSGVASAQEVTKETKDKLIEQITRILTTQAYVPGADFSKVPEMLDKQKQAIDDAKTENDFAGALMNAFSQLGLSHIGVMPPRDVQRRQTQKMVGIGVRIQPEKDGLRIVHVFPDGAASVAGVEVGDLIFEIEGKPALTPAGFAGEEGAPVKFKFRKPDGKVVDADVKRKQFSTLIPESLQWIDADSALLTIPSFYTTEYSQANVDKLMAEASKAKRLVIDLRQNPGGLVAHMLHFLSKVLPPGTEVGSFVTKSLVTRFVEETSGDPADLVAIAKWDPGKLRSRPNKDGFFKGQIAVLIGPATGSASEIVSAALREKRGAPLIGAKSAGAVLAAIQMPLDDGWMLQFPMTDYVTSGGLRIEGHGLVPDALTPPDEPLKADEAVAKAVQLLKAKDILAKSGIGGSVPKAS